MVIFTECPTCGKPTTNNIKRDISLVTSKSKFIYNVKCACGAKYHITIKLKSKLDKADIEESIQDQRIGH